MVAASGGGECLVRVHGWARMKVMLLRTPPTHSLSHSRTHLPVKVVLRAFVLDVPTAVVRVQNM